jgi:hypothetical protein
MRTELIVLIVVTKLNPCFVFAVCLVEGARFKISTYKILTSGD